MDSSPGKPINNCDRSQFEVSAAFSDIYPVEFSGVGEDIPVESETANSRAYQLRYEDECQSVERVFEHNEYRNMSGEKILDAVPVIERLSICHIWNIFIKHIEKCMISLPDERQMTETEWLAGPVVQLAKILYCLSIKNNMAPESDMQHAKHAMNKWSEVLVAELLEEVTCPVAWQETEANEIEEIILNRQDVVNLLAKIEELQNKTVCLSEENCQIQEMLTDAGKKLKCFSDENLQLKHQLYRTKVDMKEIDDLTSEISNLKRRLLCFERTEETKKEKLQEIENKKNSLYKKVHNMEEKLQQLDVFVEDAKVEIHALKNIINSQERTILKLFEEKLITEIYLNELKDFKVNMESSLNELLEANDALRLDKHNLENKLAEMHCLMGECVMQTKNSFDSMQNILYEDQNTSQSEKILISCDMQR